MNKYLFLDFDGVLNTQKHCELLHERGLNAEVAQKEVELLNGK